MVKIDGDYAGRYERSVYSSRDVVATSSPALRSIIPGRDYEFQHEYKRTMITVPKSKVDVIPCVLTPQYPLPSHFHDSKRI